MPSSGRAQRAGPFETLGAWLHIWTPPRGVEVPEVPRRKLAIIGLVSLVAIAIALAVAVPAINRSKDRASARERTREAAFFAANRKRLVAEQAAHSSSGAPATDRAGRVALIGDLEAAIQSDARARVGAGKLTGDIKSASCSASATSAIGGLPEATPSKATGIYTCIAKTADIPRPGYKTPGALGYPFQGVIHFKTGRFTWCKTNPPPGERVVPDPRLAVTLPKACTE
jgi:type II secretory pathway pseudopilin PulG